MIAPFLINSNLCTENSDVESFENFMRIVAGNTGNSYISYSLIKELCGRYKCVPQIKSIYDYDFSNSDRDADFINGNCTHVFLILQDQIRIAESYGYQLPYEKIISFLKKIKKPVVIVGCGANCLTGFDANFYKKLPYGLVCFLKELATLTECIGVRGDFSHEILDKLGVHNVETIGCPSFFEMGPDRIVRKRGCEKIAGSYDCCRNTRGRFVGFLQDVQPAEVAVARAITFGGGCLSGEFCDWQVVSKRKCRMYSSIQEWKNELSKYDFYVGTRLHGGILAINSGVPSVNMNSDSRAREMCEYLCIPYCPELSHTNNINELFNMCDVSRMNESYRDKYSRYWHFLGRFGISPCSSDEAPDSQPSLPPLYANTKTSFLKSVCCSLSHYLQGKMRVKIIAMR